ncbi:MAG TPA: hypothetical protein VGG41_10290 [Solirubrobacteraceae bacterium]|jgi:hypothetical protein
MAPEADPQLPFEWEGSSASDPAFVLEPLAQTPRRNAPRLLALAVVAALVGGVLAVGLSSVGGGHGGGAGGPVALAASVTNREPGFKFDMTVSATVAGQTTSVAGSGAFSTGPPLSGSFDATVGATTVSELIVGDDIYIQAPQSDGKWVETAIPGAFGADSSGSGGATELTSSADPGQTLQYLQAAGTVTDLGPATISGVATTHYHADIDLSHYASTLPAAQQSAGAKAIQSYEQLTGSSTLPMDVWIDSSNLVREVQFEISLAGGSSAAFTMTFSDYGPQPAVSAPPAADIIAGAQTPSVPPASTPTAPPASTPTSPPAGTPSSGSASPPSSAD